MKNKPNILLIWDRIGDYHRARWDELQAQDESGNVFGADLGGADKLYKWSSTANNERYTLLSEKPVEQKDLFNRVSNFRTCIKRNKIDVVCLGYGRLEYVLFILLAKLSGKKVIVFCESWYPRNAIIDRIKGLCLSVFADKFLVSGKRAYEHFTERYKIKSSRVKIGYSVVDNEHFKRTTESPENEQVLLCVARYAKEKNLKLLIEAFKKSTLSENFLLKIVGDGPLLNELKEIATDKVELTEWLTYDQLPAIYHQSAIFILPSLFEPWGLVVNEAMAASLPVIVSDAVGCSPDLVGPDNGGVFNEMDENALVALLDQFSSMEKKRLEEMGSCSLKKIESFSCQSWARAIIELAN